MRNQNTTTRLPSDPDPSSVIKILISTDNHLGFLEDDPIRGSDSFRAFEEVLALAKSNQVDMLLLGGDVFHDNKPSRPTLIRTMHMLREACLSPDGSVKIAVRSDPSIVNYMDPCVAVSLPVFVIHGNHDDPTGLDDLSALDLLAQAGLVTYFGKTRTSSKIDVSPVLLEKGDTRLALYGLGNIGEDTLYNTWMTERKVRWLSPEQPENATDGDDTTDLAPWFNLFVLHQNRHTRGSSRGISDTLLPPWLDYVVWGHEHDSIPDLTPSKPPIVQPGSTVATSLTAGEAKTKHAILLEVCKGNLKHRPVPLYLPRYIQFEDVILSNQDGLSTTDPDQLKKFVERLIETMIQDREAAFDKKVLKFKAATSRTTVDRIVYPPHSFYIERLTGEVRKPLIRLRIEVTGNWDPPNPLRFGQAYVGRVASAPHILLYYRNRRRPIKRTRPFLEGQGGEQGGLYDDDEYREASPFAPGATDEQNSLQIPTLVKYFLYHHKAGGTGLKFFECDKLTDALYQFVNKEEKDAMRKYIEAFLKAQRDSSLLDVTKKQKWDEKEVLQKFEQRAMMAANRMLGNENQDNDGDAAPATSAEHNAPEGPSGVAQPSTSQRIQEQLEDVHAMLVANPRTAEVTKAAAAKQKDGEDESDVDYPVEEKRAKPRARAISKSRVGAGGQGRTTPRKPAARKSTSKPPVASSRARRSTRHHTQYREESDDDDIGPAETPQEDVADDFEVVYVPGSGSRKRRAQSHAVGSQPRSASRARTESQSGSLGTRSAFANRARSRALPATIDLDEESGNDSM